MDFKSHLKQALLGDDGITGISTGSWIYAIEDINYDYAGIRPLEHTGENIDRFINADVSSFGIIEGYHPSKILEWAVFLGILPSEIKWVLAVSSGNAANFFSPYFPVHDIGADVRPLHLASFSNGMPAGIWKDLFVQRFTSATTPVYYTKVTENTKCQEYLNLRVLTAIANNIAIISGSGWDALHTWTSDQRERFAEIVTGTVGIPLPSKITVLESALAAGFMQIAHRSLVIGSAGKVPGYDKCIEAFQIWEQCLQQYTESGYRNHCGHKSPEDLIMQAKELTVTSQAGPMIAAINAGVPVEDVIA